MRHPLHGHIGLVYLPQVSKIFRFKNDDEKRCFLKQFGFNSLLHFISGMDDLGSEKSPCSSVGGISSSMGSDIMTASGGPAGSKGAGGLPGGHQQRRSRAGRVRTVLTEKQLSLLKSCYSANPRPDALMKEQMVEMSGLSPRVIRVWFQNKRCKDKKRQQLQQSKVRTNLTFILYGPSITDVSSNNGEGKGDVKNVRIYL